MRDERPEIPAGEHPLERNDFLLSTPAIEAVANEIRSWVRLHRPGGMIYGRPRLGKSTAINYLLAMREKIFPRPVICASASVEQPQRPSELRFWSNLLTGAGHSLDRTGTAERRRLRLIEYLAFRARSDGAGLVLLILDEAQWLRPIEYSWLLDLQNQLERRKVMLVTVLVGQPELLGVFESLRMTGQQQIIGRFMRRRLQFRGLRSVEDVRRVLGGYDERSDYPKGSGWSYTRFFVPQAFAAGLRLSDHADSIWAEIQRDRKGCHPQDLENGVGMQDFTGCVQTLLVELAPLDSPALSSIPDQVLHTAVADGFDTLRDQVP